MIFSPSQLTPDFDILIRVQNVPVGQNVEICQANPNRVTVLLSNLGGGGIPVWFAPTSFASVGFNVDATTSPLVFTFHDFGALVCRPFFATAAGGGGDLSIVEVIYRPER